MRWLATPSISFLGYNIEYKTQRLIIRYFYIFQVNRTNFNDIFNSTKL